jgi:acid phosphatase
VAVFFITGRRENTRAHTESNLKREGYDGWQQLVLKPDASTQTTVQYKSGARADIEQQGYRIVANVGDQYSDLAGGHEDVGFKLANPFYFLP